MKARISSKLMMPLCYGIVMGAVVGGIAAVLVFHTMLGLPIWTALVFELPLLYALWGSMRRGGWVYSNVRKLHSAEYYYNLGNGMEFKKAVNHYEGKVIAAVFLWMRRDFISRTMLGWLTAWVLLMMVESAFFRPLFLVVCAIVILCFSIYIAMWTMLLTARKLSYDNFGNQKQ